MSQRQLRAQKEPWRSCRVPQQSLEYLFIGPLHRALWKSCQKEASFSHEDVTRKSLTGGRKVLWSHETTVETHLLRKNMVAGMFFSSRDWNIPEQDLFGPETGTKVHLPAQPDPQEQPRLRICSRTALPSGTFQMKASGPACEHSSL